NSLFMNRQDAYSTRKFTLCGTGILPVLENGARCEFDPRFIVALFKIIKKTGFKRVTPRLMTKNFLMVQAPGFIREINPKSKIENPQAPAFIRGVNLKSKI
ncbi:hypothetical protein Q5692_02440, partial [Microcoleus sp. C2C3]